MNGIFPLQQFPLRERTTIYVLLTIFMVAWIIMMFAASNKTSGVAAGILLLMKLSFVLAAAIGTVQMKALARAREVIGGRPLPDSLWRTWVRACIVETSLICAFLAAGMGLLMAFPAADAAWPAAVALLSSGLCLGALCALGRYAMLPKVLGWLANAAAVALLLALLYFRSTRVLAWFMSLPLPLLALLTLSWPMLAAAMALRRRGKIRPRAGAQQATGAGWTGAVAASIRRYCPLDPTWRRQLPHQQATVRSRLQWVWQTAFYWMMCANLLTPLRWGERPDARHLLSLLVAGVLMSRLLVARDLHWRGLLMPGGWRAGRIASAIFKSTVQTIYLGIVLAVVVALLAAVLLTSRPGEELIATVASYVLVLAEIAFAVSVGLVVRALPRSGGLTAAAAIIVGGAWLYVVAEGHGHLWKAPPAGALYAAILVAASYAVLRLANRLWTNDKLMACARGSA